MIVIVNVVSSWTSVLHWEANTLFYSALTLPVLCFLLWGRWTEIMQPLQTLSRKSITLTRCSLPSCSSSPHKLRCLVSAERRSRGCSLISTIVIRMILIFSPTSSEMHCGKINVHRLMGTFVHSQISVCRWNAAGTSCCFLSSPQTWKWKACCDNSPTFLTWSDTMGSGNVFFFFLSSR